MSDSQQTRARAWNILRGNYWYVFLVTIIGMIATSIPSFFSGFSEGLVEQVTLLAKNENADPEVIGVASIVLVVIAAAAWLISMALTLFVSNPLTVGCYGYFTRAVDGTPSISQIFSDFRVNYLGKVKTMFLVSLKVFLWTLLFIVPGIIKGFEYAMIPYILADNPGISSKEAFEKTKEMMTGNKWRFFKLQFSFIGWILLSFFTCGVGIIFLTPYMEMANAVFYRELKDGSSVQY